MKNQRGMSLVEVMISLGIMGLMATYMMQMQTNNQKQYRRIANQVEEMNFLRRVRQLFEATEVLL